MTLDRNDANVYINHLRFHMRYASEKDKTGMAELLLAMEAALQQHGHVDTSRLRSNRIAVNYQLNK